MKPTELSDLSAAQATDTEMPAVAPPPRTHAGRSLSPKLECFAAPAAAQPLRPLMPGVANTPHIYALGRIEARFPDLAAEKEFAQASGRAESAGKTDLPVRQLCWVLTIQGLETYLLRPRDPAAG